MREDAIMMSNIYVIDVDMEKRNSEDIAKDAAIQIAALCDKLLEERQKEGQKGKTPLRCIKKLI